MEAVNSPRWRSWVLLIVCALSGLIAFLGFVILMVLGVISRANTGVQESNASMLIFLAWESLAVAGFCIPIIVISIRKLANISVTPRASLHGLRNASIGMAVWVLLVGLFYLLERSSLSWLLLPPLAAIATALPIWWLVEFARRRLKQAPAERSWGIIGFSLTFTMPAVLVVSVIALIVVFVIMAAYLSTQPELMGQLRMYAQLYSNTTPDPQTIINSLSSFIQQPAILLWVFVVISGVIPLVEEGMKTLAVWLFAGDRMTPGEGFVAGILCGASFAFLESFSALNSTSANGDGSATLALLVRVGTGLLHVTTAGMVGWGIASAVQSRRNLYKLVLVYLAGVTLHGSWNAASIMAGVGASMVPFGLSSGIETALAEVAVVILVVLVPLNLSILSGFNRHIFRRQTLAAAVETSTEPALLEGTDTVNSDAPQTGSQPDDE